MHCTPVTPVSNLPSAPIRVLLTCLCLMASLREAYSQALTTESQKFGLSDAQSSDRLGFDIAIADDRAAATAVGRESVHVFLYDGRDWVESQELAYATNIHFGYHLAMSGDWLVISAEDNEEAGTRTGSVLVYLWNGTSYELHQIIHGEPDEELGLAVDIDGSVLVAGGRELAVVYRLNGMTFDREQVLTGPAAVLQSAFGQSVAVAGDRIVVGAHLENEGPFGSNLDAGAIYIFEWNESTWVGGDAELADTPQGLSQFGFSIDTEGETIMVGAPNYNLGLGQDSGAVYFLENVSGVWAQTLITPANPVSSLDFGFDVSLSGETAVAGAWDEGGAFVLRKTSGTWQEQFRVSARDPSFAVIPGTHVAINESHILQCDFADSENGDDAGALYAYHHAAFPLNGNSFDDGPNRVLGITALALEPLAPFLPVITEVAGSPIFFHLGIQATDTQGSFSTNWIIPSALVGLEVGLQGFGLDPLTGKVVATNSLPVDL